jgi:uncharacterized membrane protein (UPF0127 family)
MHRLNIFHAMPAFSARFTALRTPSRRPALALAAALLGLLGAAGAPQVRAEDKPQLQLPRTELRAGMFRIDAQVAQTFNERQTGLMHRKEMPAHEGMLFVFEQPARQCFWMKNTLLPLTAAFVADDGTIVNLADMQPLSEASHCSAQPVRYVLEMNQGWFAQKNLKAGAKLTGRPFTSR